MAIGILSPSQLANMRYSAQGWVAVLNYNFTRINDALLKVSAMQDVDLTGLGNNYLMYYQTSSSKFKVRPSRDFFSTTTTTTTTTTTA